MDLTKYIKLEDIGLDERTGINGKVRKLIIQDLAVKKVHTRSVECDKSYRNNYSSQRAYHAGYSSTYERKVYEYFYNINRLKQWFKKNQVIKFNRAEIDIWDIASQILDNIQEAVDKQKEEAKED